MNKLMLTLSLIAIIPLTGQARVKCADFDSQQEAQQYMEQNNAGYLDRDKDGEACECLPGGSKYGSSRCPQYSR